MTDTFSFSMSNIFLQAGDLMMYVKDRNKTHTTTVSPWPSHVTHYSLIKRKYKSLVLLHKYNTI